MRETFNNYILKGYKRKGGKCCGTCKHHIYQDDRKYIICYKDESYGEEVCEFGVCENWEE